MSLRFVRLFAVAATGALAGGVACGDGPTAAAPKVIAETVRAGPQSPHRAELPREPIGPALGAPASERVFIAAGMMGHEFVESFELDRTEVTVGAYKKCVAAGVCRIPAEGEVSTYYFADGDDYPVNEVSAFEAEAFCAWVGGRLPTDREWEWAASGRGEGRLYPWGDSPADCERAVMDDRGAGFVLDVTARWGCGTAGPMPVGSKPRGRSRDGVVDLAGNLAEWTASSKGPKRRTRGGTWMNNERHLLAPAVGARGAAAPDGRSLTLGFRCAKSKDRRQRD